MDKPTVVDLPSYIDDRGVLAPVWNFVAHTTTPDACVGNAGAQLYNVKRAYFIQNSQKGIIRGFHFHEEETKYFVVLRGMAKFVTIKGELCPHFAYRGEPETFVLSDRKQQMLIVPPNHANGWMSLTDDCLLLALSSSTFEESKDDDYRIPPHHFKPMPGFGDLWGIEAR